MSYSPLTGLVYLPYQEIPATYANEGGNFVVRNAFNTGSGLEKPFVAARVCHRRADRLGP
ncbi:hypothetical protein ULG90_07585 [Halopseudomonas pachastrellae]|nr:hypothetical protein ULG90_07585 [Halopseudomonas pachastrellae]